MNDDRHQAAMTPDDPAGVADRMAGIAPFHVMSILARAKALEAAGRHLRDLRLWRTVRSFRPDVIVTRSPAGVHAARLTRTPVVYDTACARTSLHDSSWSQML